MKARTILATLSAAVLLAGQAVAQTETAAQRDARMKWWREARFGMFVHWGLYSALAGTWDGKPVATSGGMEWIQQRVKADTDTYASKAIPKFHPKPGFAREWARLAKEAGCKYVVFTTKHHDGFALHDSKVSDYDAGSVLQRDLVREIVDALHAEGLRVGFYHSVIDWHHDQYEYARSKQLPHPLLGKPYPNGQRDHQKYLQYLHGEVNELVSNYGPIDVLWWDYSAVDFQGQEAWRAFDLMSMVRAKQPNIIMNNRLFRIPEAGFNGMGTAAITAQLDPRYGDFITPEQHIPATGMPGVDWETCMTMNTTWGYSDHDHKWKSPETLIRNLVDIASKGGNYLLNIGPKADGSVPEESVDAMKVIGAWMKVNGDAIYATNASPFEKLDWGRATRKSLPGGGTRLYLHVFDWPQDGKLVLPLAAGRGATARLLATGNSLPVTASEQQTAIQVGGTAPDKIASVVVLDIQGAPKVVASAPVRENIEWLDVWIPNTNDHGLPRVLLIGDSITRGYGKQVEAGLKGKAFVARLATSKSLGDPALLDEVALVLREHTFDVIHFNNGMHGDGYTEEAYAAALPELLATLRKGAPKARIVFATTTDVRDRNKLDQALPKTDRMIKRNQIVTALAKRENLPVDDLFSVIKDHPEYHAVDGVHFTEAGYEVLARQVVAELLKVLP